MHGSLYLLIISNIITYATIICAQHKMAVGYLMTTLPWSGVTKKQTTRASAWSYATQNNFNNGVFLSVLYLNLAFPGFDVRGFAANEQTIEKRAFQ
jgi:hypothetical protein